MAMTEQPSVTGTAGEAAFGAWLSERLSSHPILGAKGVVWTIEVNGRYCVALLVRGSGRETVILTGHYDTVSLEDYGDLTGLATRPDELRLALLERLNRRATTEAELRAKADLTTEDFLPGRGLLDMKAGLAAGLAVAEAFAADPHRNGNILFIAVPDEENNSAGARRAAPELAAIAAQHHLTYVAAINLDAIADNTDGSRGRVIALGTVGKVLPTAYVVGQPSHSGFPLNGLNAATILSSIAARLEWAAELTDMSASQPGTPPSLLSICDGKAAYDVTTPASAFAAWNVLMHKREPADILDAFDKLCAEGASAHLAALKQRAEALGMRGACQSADRIPIYRYEFVSGHAAIHNPSAYEKLEAFRAELLASGRSLPDQCRLLTERMWAASGLPGPAVITGFGSIPYLPTTLSDTPAARSLKRIAEEAAARWSALYGATITCVDYFAGISDMSFFGEADEQAIGIVARNTPMWDHAVRWPDNALGRIPTINVGPWGRDYHTPLERLHTGYAFEVLPSLLLDIVDACLSQRSVESHPA